jgi:hypothetical protein
MSRALLVCAVLSVVAFALVGVGATQACVCAERPLDERLDDADAAVVARLVGVRESQSFPPQRTLTFEVDQHVKGDVESTFEVDSQPQSNCALDVEENVPVGLLLIRGPAGEWRATTCSVVSAGELVAEGGETRGGAIKVVLGVVVLAIVLSWALRRRARGTRPQLPGAPEP